MKEVTNQERAEQLQALLNVLAASIDSKPGARDLAALAKQYRETLAELEQIKGATQHGDDISQILENRAGAGKPGAVR